MADKIDENTRSNRLNLFRGARGRLEILDESGHTEPKRYQARPKTYRVREKRQDIPQDAPLPQETPKAEKQAEMPEETSVFRRRG